MGALWKQRFLSLIHYCIPRAEIGIYQGRYQVNIWEIEWVIIQFYFLFQDKGLFIPHFSIHFEMLAPVLSDSP